MNTLEWLFKKYQITCPDDYGKKNFHSLCHDIPRVLLGKWFFSRAYRIQETNWVVKEGRWDIDIPLIFWTTSIHGQPIQKLLSPFSYKFLPTKEESWRQYQEYLVLCRYFGFFDEEYWYYPEFDAIKKFQNGLRSNLDIFGGILKQRFGIQIPNLGKDFPVYHNFLPREYIGYGTALSKENKNKETSYIVQEFIAWVPFAEKKLDQFSQEELRQVFLLTIITLIFYIQTGKIPDTRPSHDPKHWWQWFLHTENIFATPSRGIQMIDTRWLWSVDENVIKRWIIIPELILQSVIRAAKKIQKMINS